MSCCTWHGRSWCNGAARSRCRRRDGTRRLSFEGRASSGARLATNPIARPV
jgi:hypothetical protein